MMAITIIEFIDILLWLIIAVNVFYVLFFAIASLLPKKKNHPSAISHQPSFLVLFPAYHEDAVILHSIESFLHQDYPQDHYHVVVISDNMNKETNEQLATLPITLLQPTMEKSSKAKALQFAISSISHHPSSIYDYVVILDADNIVAQDFLTKLSKIAKPHQAIQCHRTAKNTDNNIAALDGFSEEINNSLFRKGHYRIGMSSALIGSGMCFDYNWFASNVSKLDSAVEDRELEALLMKQGIYIHYAEDIYVMDEKVSNSDNFQRQRLRWMTGQVQALFRMLPYIPKAIITGNINYIDKTIQQALIPRSILFILTPMLCIIATLTSSIIHLPSSFFPLPSSLFHLKWWCLFFALYIALYLAIPKRMRQQSLLNRLRSLPILVWKMILNVMSIDHNNKEFIHTSHEK